MNLLWLLTGGRPMVREGFAFTDHVSGRSICYYRDQLGRRWLAEHAWSFFRAERNNAALATQPQEKGS